MKNKIFYGLLFGAIAGVIDVTPMILQKLSWDANLSAFSMWVIVGFLIATSNLNLKPVFKGWLYSFIALIPCAILIAWQEPLSLLPIVTLTLILGGLLGVVIINKVIIFLQHSEFIIHNSEFEFFTI